MTTSTKDIRVLYMHGLESGINGVKVQKLKKSFNVHAVDMNIRWLASRQAYGWALVTVYVVVVSIFAWRLATFGGGWLAVVAAVLFLAGSIVLLEQLLRKLLRIFLNAAVSRQADAIASFKPDVVVGSSFGGAIAMLCIDRGLWHGPTLLLAPAFHKVCNLARMPLNFTMPPSVRMHIVHGTKDNTVPIDDSRLIANALRQVTLEEINDDHRLKSTTEGSLKRNVLSLLQRTS
eukprot:TRINITY_DN15436_c0_g1_i1.p1 TRINITY_DN15436_c0_g1~~TRINITY_DN15436_c0_g1_i1.p1  ORF type:complete len:233 (+),score=62.53 TRINITY_DN15436_c0_g1_i1:88-786(+)